MSAKVIQAKYDEILLIAQAFDNLATRAATQRQNLTYSRNSLDGEWIGYGAENFFDEMESGVLPAFDNLKGALSGTAELLRQIKDEFLETEIAAANLLAPKSPIHPDQADGLVPPPPPPQSPVHPDIEQGLVPSAEPPEAPVAVPEGPIQGPVLPADADYDVPLPELPIETEGGIPAAVFEDDWIGPIVLIELQRPAIQDTYVEVNSTLKVEGSMGVASGSSGVENTKRFRLGSWFSDLIADENRFFTEAEVGFDAPILGNGPLPDLSAGAGVFVEIPLDDHSGEPAGGTQATVDLIIGGTQVRRGSNDMSTYEASLNIPVSIINGDGTGNAPDGADWGMGGAGSVAIVHEKSNNNFRRAAVPKHIYEQYNGNLEKIHREFLVDTINADGSEYTPTGRVEHIETMVYYPHDDTVRVSTINQVLDAPQQRRLAAARSNRTYTEVPQTVGEIFFPTKKETNDNLFDYSGGNYRDHLLKEAKNGPGVIVHPREAWQGKPNVKVEFYDGPTIFVPKTTNLHNDS